MIRIIILLLLFITLKANAQINSEDYLLLNKVIEFTNSSSNKNFKLNELARSTNSRAFKNYYNYKFLKRKTFTMFNYDKIKDTIKELDEAARVKLEKSVYSKYTILDEVLTEADFLKIIQSKIKSKWDSLKLKSNTVIKIGAYPPKTSHSGFYGGYFISIPYYTIDKNYALVSFSSSGKLPTLYIFKKEKNLWIKYGSIEQFFH